MTLLSFGNALLTPTVSSLLTAYAPEDAQGKVLGTNQALVLLLECWGQLLVALFMAFTSLILMFLQDLLRLLLAY